MDDILEFIFEGILEFFSEIVEAVIKSILPAEKRSGKWIRFVSVVFSIICVIMVLILILGIAFLVSDEGDKSLGKIFLGVSALWLSFTVILSIIVNRKNKSSE